MAFAPDYATSGRFYVDYTDRVGQRQPQRRRVPALSGRPRSRPIPTRRRQILDDRRSRGRTTTPGCSSSAPTATCTSRSATATPASLHPPGAFAQTLDDLLGNILRIDPLHPTGDDAVLDPATRIRSSGQAGARGEVWDYGLRNPWRFWIDPVTGDLYIGDAGRRRARGDRLRRRATPGGLELRLAVLRGHGRRSTRRRRATTPVAPGLRVRPRRRPLRGDRRRRRPRPAPAVAWTAATCSATTATGSCTARSDRRTARRRTSHDLGLVARRRSARSASTGAAASTLTADRRRRVPSRPCLTITLDDVLARPRGDRRAPAPHADVQLARRSPSASARASHLKAELFQRTGSFKPRGVLTSSRRSTPRSGRAA